MPILWKGLTWPGEAHTRDEELSTNEPNPQRRAQIFRDTAEYSVSKYFVRSSGRLARERTLSIQCRIQQHHYMNQYFEIEMKVATLRPKLRIHEPAEPNPSCVSQTLPSVLRQRCPKWCPFAATNQTCRWCACASPKSGKDTMTWDQKWVRRSWNPKTTTFCNSVRIWDWSNLSILNVIWSSLDQFLC